MFSVSFQGLPKGYQITIFIDSNVSNLDQFLERTLALIAVVSAQLLFLSPQLLGLLGRLLAHLQQPMFLHLPPCSQQTSTSKVFCCQIYQVYRKKLIGFFSRTFPKPLVFYHNPYRILKVCFLNPQSSLPNLKLTTQRYQFHLGCSIYRQQWQIQTLI